jgi:hypothetical protein
MVSTNDNKNLQLTQLKMWGWFLKIYKLNFSLSLLVNVHYYLFNASYKIKKKDKKKEK